MGEAGEPARLFLKKEPMRKKDEVGDVCPMI